MSGQFDKPILPARATGVAIFTSTSGKTGRTMHARLTSGERNKIEKEIGVLYAKLHESANCSDQRIIELERLLEQQKSQLADAKSEMAKAAQQQKDIEKQLAAAKDELNVRATDIKVQGLEISSLKKEIEGLQGQMGDAQAEARKLQDSLNATAKELDQARADGAAGEREMAMLRATISEYESTDRELRERIVTLEKMLVKERQRVGQDLMARILELESMLDVERRKVEDLPEIPEIAEVKMTTRKVVKAANAESVATTKKNLAKKMG